MAGIFWASFEKGKLKSHLSMALARIKIHQNRLSNDTIKSNKEVAALLKIKKFDLARINVEAVIGMENKKLALERIAAMCEVVLGRIDLIASEKECPADMLVSVRTLMWAAKRSGIDELPEVARQFSLKYGDVFAAVAQKGNGINVQVENCLTVSAPTGAQVVDALTRIAKNAGIEFDAARDLSHSDIGLGAPPAGGLSTTLPSVAPLSLSPATSPSTAFATSPASKDPVPVAEVAAPVGIVYIDPTTGQSFRPVVGPQQPFSYGIPIPPQAELHADSRDSIGPPPPYMPTATSSGYTYGGMGEPSGIPPIPPPPAIPSLPSPGGDARAFAMHMLAGSGVSVPEGSNVTVILPTEGSGAYDVRASPAHKGATDPDVPTKDAAGAADPLSIDYLQARFAQLRGKAGGTQ